jgi:folate-binding protein YgfZ
MSLADTIEKSAGWIDRRARGRLRLGGRDAVPFLHALVSNDIARLSQGEGCYATYLTPQGRMIADMRVYHLGDRLLLDVAPGVAAALAVRLDQLIFAEELEVADISAAFAQIGIIGGGAAAAIGRLLGVAAAVFSALDLHAIRWSGMRTAQHTFDDVMVARTDDALVPSFDIFVPAAEYEAIVTRLGAAGVEPFSAEVATALRIEAGHGAFDIDMTNETIPLEAGLLDRAISLTKGCYVGQEVIIRVLHRGGGRVAKRLVTIVFDAGMTSPPDAGTILTVDGRDVGRITSAAISPARARVVALGYVNRDDAEASRAVAIASGTGVITGLAS